jgi:ribonuclease BN (tRNA processing enzyme)
MKLIILGSGTCVPSLKRSAPAYYLEAEGRQILIDCGSGTLLQLEKLSKSYKDIDAVFITHPHPDHVAGIMPLIHALLATPLFMREKALLLVGPKGFKKFYEKGIASVMGRPKTFSIQIIEIEDKMDYPPFHVFAAGTVHSENSIAFRLEHGGKSVVITGDADYDQGIIELSRNCDLLIADCSFPESMKAGGHMTPKECGLVAKKAGVKKLLLSHLHTLPFPDTYRLKECQQVFKGDVSLAEDLLEFNL